MSWQITNWLHDDNWPSDFYELLGRSRFDPEVGEIAAAIHAAHSLLQPFQQHADLRKVDRARRLQLEVAKAEATFAEPERRSRYDQTLVMRMAEGFAAERQHRPEMGFVELCDWLAGEKKVHERLVSTIAQALLASSTDCLDWTDGSLPAETFLDKSPYGDTVEEFASFDTIVDMEHSRTTTSAPISHSHSREATRADFTGSDPTAKPRQHSRNPAESPSPTRPPARRAEIQEINASVPADIDVDAIILRVGAVVGVVIALVLGFLIWRAAIKPDGAENQSNGHAFPTSWLPNTDNCQQRQIVLGHDGRRVLTRGNDGTARLCVLAGASKFYWTCVGPSGASPMNTCPSSGSGSSRYSMPALTIASFRI
jgi:hypothetical protein